MLQLLSEVRPHRFIYQNFNVSYGGQVQENQREWQKRFVTDTIVMGLTFIKKCGIKLYSGEVLLCEQYILIFMMPILLWCYS